MAFNEWPGTCFPKDTTYFAASCCQWLPSNMQPSRRIASLQTRGLASPPAVTAWGRSTGEGSLGQGLIL